MRTDRPDPPTEFEAFDAKEDPEHFALWQRESPLDECRKRFYRHASTFHQLKLLPYLVLVAGIFIFAIHPARGVATLTFAVMLSILPSAMVGLSLLGKGFGNLSSDERFMLFMTSLRLLYRTPRRDELLVIPGMREDAKSIFFVLSYWMK